jgi:hypothetical protein
MRPSPGHGDHRLRPPDDKDRESSKRAEGHDEREQKRRECRRRRVAIARSRCLSNGVPSGLGACRRLGPQWELRPEPLETVRRLLLGSCRPCPALRRRGCRPEPEQQCEARKDGDASGTSRRHHRTQRENTPDRRRELGREPGHLQGLPDRRPCTHALQALCSMPLRRGGVRACAAATRKRGSNGARRGLA